LGAVRYLPYDLVNDPARSLPILIANGPQLTLRRRRRAHHLLGA
jgi:hypothetical protein